MKDTIKKVKSMGKEAMYGVMGQDIWVIGMTTKLMGQEYIPG